MFIQVKNLDQPVGGGDLTYLLALYHFFIHSLFSQCKYSYEHGLWWRGQQLVLLTWDVKVASQWLLTKWHFIKMFVFEISKWK